MLEAQIDSLLAKGIRPIDIAKIYDLDTAEVRKYITEKKKKQKAEIKESECIKGMIKAADIDTATAEKIYAFLKLNHYVDD